MSDFFLRFLIHFNMLEFLPKNLQTYFNFNMDKLYEIRLRVNQEILVFFDKEYIFLKDLSKTQESIVCRQNDIDFIINFITENSIYAFNEEIKQGYITYKNGVRFGLCGKVISEHGQVKTITNISSINVRIPHEISGISNNLLNKIIIKDEIKNTLIFSPPFLGKTTLIKDLAKNINNNYFYQILVIDERGEFENVNGKNIDKISFSKKDYAFNYIIRSMSPEIIICDEIYSENDWNFLNEITKTGIKVIVTCHAEKIEDILRKQFFNKEIFDIYIQIKKEKEKGIIGKIYNKNFELIC